MQILNVNDACLQQLNIRLEKWNWEILKFNFPILKFKNSKSE